MVVALVASVSFLLSCTLAVLVGRFLTRRDLARSDGAFRCRVRVEAGAAPGIGPRYGRRWRLGGWAHDVLLLRRAGGFPRLVPYPVRSADQLASVDGRPELMSIRLCLDSGAVIRLVANRRSKAQLVGPFLMAEIERLAIRDS